MIYTKNARKAVWIRIEAHSCLRILKSLAGARATAARAALNASEGPTTDEVSEASEADWYPSALDPDELRHSFHFRPFPFTPNICSSKDKELINNNCNWEVIVEETRLVTARWHCLVLNYLVVFVGFFKTHYGFDPLTWSTHSFNFLLWRKDRSFLVLLLIEK